MPLVLRALTEKDTLAWTRIRTKAYFSPLHVLVHTQPVAESSFIGVAEDRKKEIGKPNTWQWKIVDTELPPTADDPEDNGGCTIAIAIWSAYNMPGKAGTKRSGGSVHDHGIDAGWGEQDQPFIPPELRLDILSALLGPLRAAQEEIMGKETPYLKLNTLATHPNHQRRGAGKMLLEWGLSKADKEGLKMYLDASAKGYKVYEKAGFKTVREVTFDMEKWGGKGEEWWACMVREPRKDQGL